MTTEREAATFAQRVADIDRLRNAAIVSGDVHGRDAFDVAVFTAWPDLLACIREQRAALADAEEGYRERCEYCGGSERTCIEWTGTCRAKDARATLARYPLPESAKERA